MIKILNSKQFLRFEHLDFDIVSDLDIRYSGLISGVSL